ncbi:MAG: serine hydrolase [Lachnospiraceae bacterium]|nr:serine hydrolase [Lachnospiraceae bacterium]
MTLKTKMEKLINSSYNNIGGIVVQKKGQTVYEKYYNECDAGSTFHVYSVTKSIISILIGIALEKGYIESIEQNVLDFFPDYTFQKGEKNIQNVTIKNLLTMTAPYKYKTEPYTEYFSSEDWVKASLDFLGGRGKIGEFRYTPLIGPDILSGILVKATGQSVLEFATKYLFEPLEMNVESNLVFHNKEEQMAFYEAKNVKGWVADPKGVNTAGWGLNLTAKDMAKIGQLYLDKGMWNGKQLVSYSWIQESTKEQAKGKQWKLPYGYLWWIMNEKEHTYAAMGDGGNIIYVNEKKEMVISIASIYVKNAKDRITLIKEYMEPVFYA